MGPPSWPDPHSQRSQLVRYLSDRTAVLAMGQLPLIILMSGRNSPVALLSGLDMNDLMLYHRYLARFAWMQVNIHSFGFVAEGIMAKEMAANFKKPCFNWGVAATAMFWALIVLSIRELRNRHYEIFVFCHIIFGMLALVGTYLHIHLLRESRYAIFTDLTIISAVLWAFDRAIRFANQIYQSLRPSNGRTILQAVITTFPGNHLRLRIPIALNRIALCGDDRVGFGKIAAGHYVRLTAPDIQWVGDHPFTVMATGIIDSRVGYFDLAIKAQRGFTRKLGLSVADNHEYRSTTLVAGIKVKVEGPYGRSPEHNALPKCLFSMAGCFEIIKEQIMFLVDERRKRGDAAQGSLSIDLHLTCGPAIKLCGQRNEPDNPSAGRDFDLEDAVPALYYGDIDHEPVVNDDTGLKIASDTELKHTDDTQIEFAKPTEPLPAALPSLDGDSFSPLISITTYTGRASLLPSAHLPPSDLNATQYVSIVACGPAGMCDEARVGAMQTISEGRWKGVEFIEECYSWIQANGDCDLRTLASLDVTARDIHEGTLPVLYETAGFANEKSFERSVELTSPKGWKYVNHLRYQTQSLPTPTNDPVAFFPRLTLLGFTDVNSPTPPLRIHDPPLHVTLYKPMRFTSLLRACIPYKSPGSRSGITIFGTPYYRQIVTKGSIKTTPNYHFRNIVRLDVPSGARMLREKGWIAIEMEGWHAAFCGKEFRLTIADGIDEREAEDTLRTVVARLTLLATSEPLIASGKNVVFKFGMLAESFRKCEAQQPCFLDDLTVNLTTPVGKSTMKRYLATLSEIYLDKNINAEFGSGPLRGDSHMFSEIVY
ncbi:hypothetical protein QFC21_003997 [Naganishia friedmannii]|uniref:Uncharacterized protein n=1 Tax=Naganishia friedmannii TaxID=89922 RepID=A0ACC2VJ01_9TREE|nr:hypothetical protein QFC21_003997 [Naganishia friedmannii]